MVGVVGNIKYRGLNALDDAAVYQPFPQFPWRTVSLVVRADGDPAGAMQRTRAVLRQLDPELAVASVAPMSDRIDEALAQPRYWAFLATVFGSVGTLLAAIGVYGVLTYSVARRTRDIGVRMALGATRGSVQRLVLRRGLGYAATGSGVGLGLTLIVQRWLDRLLFGVTTGNGPALAAILVCMLSVAAIACLLPARRATRIDPVVALAAE